MLKSLVKPVILEGSSNPVVSLSAKPKKPDEIQYPPHTPEIRPAEEPSPIVWPTRQPEIVPDPEKIPSPSKPPIEIPPPPDSRNRLNDVTVVTET